MQIVSDNLHEISNPYSWEKNKENISSAEKFTQHAKH